MTARGLSERRDQRECQRVALSAGAGSQPGPAGANRGAGSAASPLWLGDDYLKLRQAGVVANHKRVEPLYAEARLQVRRRRRKKVPAADRQPLGRKPPIRSGR